MRSIIIFLALLLSLQGYGQKMYVKLQQENGVSGLTRGILPFTLKYSQQTTLVAGLFLNEKLGISLGAGFQQAGARSKLSFSDTPGNFFSFYQSYSINYIKIPLDLSVDIGKSGLFCVDLGLYFNFISSFSLSQVPDPDIASYHIFTDYSPFEKNDIGIRIRPAFNIPLSEETTFSIGILQEFGLIGRFPDTRNYNTCLSASIKFGL